LTGLQNFNQLEIDNRVVKVERNGEPAGTYVCLDDFKDLVERKSSSYLSCGAIGLTKMVNGKNALESFKDHLTSLKPKRTSITALKWSDELAYSASMFVKEMEGCSVYANQLWKDGH